jgi:hypothetical protein
MSLFSKCVGVAAAASCVAWLMDSLEESLAELQQAPLAAMSTPAMEESALKGMPSSERLAAVHSAW